MSKQSSAKSHPARSAPPTPPPGRSKSFLFAALAVILAVFGVVAFWQSRDTAARAVPEPAAQNESHQKKSIADVHPTPADEAAAAAAAALGPHKQSNLPPIPFQGYAPPRSPEVITAAYQFAAEHPEILSYVPCFCGCQHSGHRGNADCFVHSRAANGDVTKWDEHGVECAVCIDVATRSRQMYASGASVRDIRAAIEKEFVPMSQTMTPTPRPPAQ